MPSQSPPGCVRKVVKSSVKMPGEGGQEPAPALPAGGRHRPPDLRGASAGIASATRKNEPITKTVMNVVSLVANDGARQSADQRRVVLARPLQEAPDGDEQRERDRGDVDVLAGEAAEVQVARAEGEQHRRGERGAAAEQLAQRPAQRRPSTAPSGPGASRAVKSESPNSTYISAVR